MPASRICLFCRRVRLFPRPGLSVFGRSPSGIACPAQAPKTRQLQDTLFSFLHKHKHKLLRTNRTASRQRSFELISWKEEVAATVLPSPRSGHGAPPHTLQGFVRVPPRHSDKTMRCMVAQTYPERSQNRAVILRPHFALRAKSTLGFTAGHCRSEAVPAGLR
jgi:hypothetical protein